MKITFVSNYINHHQIPFSNATYQIIGEGYHFIQMEPMEEERIQMGWSVDIAQLPYLLCYEQQKEYCDLLIEESDLVIFGGTEQVEVIKLRLEQNKLTIQNSERLYRHGQWKAISPRGLIKKYKDHTKYRKKNVYLFSIGGYTASDFQIVRSYPNKKFKWGYFPETKHYDIEQLMNQKIQVNQSGEQVIKLLWAGRFIPLKHPEYPIRLAQQLKEEGYSFCLTMIGGGELENELKQQVMEMGLEKEVIFPGFLKPDQVRTYMEQSNIYLFTSNFLEGWGAVVNEAMNSGCAVVLNHGVGCASYLIKDEENGLIYKNGCYEMFYQKVKSLLNYPQKAEILGKKAYETITTTWNAEHAAQLLIDQVKILEKGIVRFEKDGPFSKAEVIWPCRMFSKLRKQQGKDKK